jgi:hypothetical protein
MLTFDVAVRFFFDPCVNQFIFTDYPHVGHCPFLHVCELLEIRAGFNLFILRADHVTSALNWPHLLLQL